MIYIFYSSICKCKMFYLYNNIFLVDDDNDADDGNNEDIEIRGLTFFLKKTKFFI